MHDPDRDHTVPTEVVQWKADFEFTPLNASEFLNPKVQEKWETLLPGMSYSESFSCCPCSDGD
jgi:hypothetical protein